MMLKITLFDDLTILRHLDSLLKDVMKPKCTALLVLLIYPCAWVCVLMSPVTSPLATFCLIAFDSL